MAGLSPIHLLLILLVVLIVVGPGKLPEAGAAIGKSIREFRRSMGETPDSGSSGQAQAQAAPVAPPVAYAPTAYPPQYPPAYQPPTYQPAPYPYQPAYPMPNAGIPVPPQPPSIETAQATEHIEQPS